MEFKKNTNYKSITSSETIIKDSETCGKTCNNKCCFCGKI